MSVTPLLGAVKRLLKHLDFEVARLSLSYHESVGFLTRESRDMKGYMKAICLVAVSQIVSAGVLSAQRIEPSPFVSHPAVTVRSIAAAISPASEPKPPLSGAAMATQAIAGGLGGLAGAFVAFVPLALDQFDGTTDVSDDTMVVAVIVGYYAGTIIGVQEYSKRALGLRGSWKATALGAALGVLGGPAVLFTMPIGATIGFDRTRRLR